MNPESEQGGFGNAEEEEEGAMIILGFFVCFCFFEGFFLIRELFLGAGWGEESIKDSQIFFLVHE